MNATLSKPIPVRLTGETLSDLREIEDYTGTDRSKLLRLAIKLGMPEVRRRFGAEGAKPEGKGGLER